MIGDLDKNSTEGEEMIVKINHKQDKDGETIILMRMKEIIHGRITLTF
jgi:hypothetical protein